MTQSPEELHKPRYWRCPNCGHAIPNGTTTCSNCGWQSQVWPPQVSPGYQAAPVKQAWYKLVGWAMLGLLAGAASTLATTPMCGAGLVLGPGVGIYLLNQKRQGPMPPTMGSQSPFAWGFLAGALVVLIGMGTCMGILIHGESKL